MLQLGFERVKIGAVARPLSSMTLLFVLFADLTNNLYKYGFAGRSGNYLGVTI